jgi:phospholipase/carboxylesterase
MEPTIYFQPGKSSRTFILFHGTGGDEKDLIPLAQSIDPEANYLGIAGSIIQDGLRRYFLRYPDGSFDVEEVKLRVHELSEVILRSITQYQLDTNAIIYLGYSNGATTVAALSVLFPDLRHPALLFRPALPFFEQHPPTGKVLPLLILLGQNDPYTDPNTTSKLVTLLERSGFQVTATMTAPGHGLNQTDVLTAQQFISNVIR